MPALITNKYKTFLAKNFLAGLTANTLQAYVFVGRPQQWIDDANNAVSDSAPPVPVDDVQTTDFDHWRDMLGMKRVSDANTQIVVARRDWTANTIYDQYDDLDVSLASKAFYVLDTSMGLPYKVYKCLWNNKGGHSTSAPTTIGTALTPQTTADGYVWQYMYTIGTLDRKFLTTQWMPVLSNTVIANNATTNQGKLPLAVPLLVTNSGANYNASATVTVTLEGDGNSASVVSGGVTIQGGAVTAVQLADGGKGYTEVTSINVFQSGATSATVRAIIPPYPNHGHDPAKELFCKAVMLTTQFEQDEIGKLTVENNYRRVGLIINPVDANGNVALDDFYRTTTELTLSGNTGGFALDDDITNITKATPKPTALVVDVVVIANNYVVRVTDVNDEGYDVPFAFNDIIKVGLAGSEGTISGVTNPELTPYSGEIIFVNQRTPVTRNLAQIEEIKLVFPFN
jgi:hypothetical protein